MSQKSDVKSPRKAARERIAPEVERLKGEAVAALPASPTKLQQLEALVRAGRVADPLAGIEAAELCTHADPHPAAQERGDPPPCRGREEQASVAAAQQPTLLRRTQYLYEQTVVPVREIARLVGVTERTLYKYVARYGWQRRHLCIARQSGSSPHPARTLTGARHPLPQAGEGKNALQTRGAGGRFIAYEERGVPSPRGPKALDPMAAEAIGGLCERAALSSNLAISEVVAAATIEEARERASRIDHACARTLGEAARIVRALARIALADDECEEAERAERKRQAEDKAAAAARTEELRRDLTRKLQHIITERQEEERQSAEAARKA